MGTELEKSKPRPLAKLDELYANMELASKHNELNRLLNCNPKIEWVKEHPMYAGVKYIPVSIIEYLLTSIFIKWRVEVKETKLIANSVQVTVRLWVLDPVSFEWDWQEGIGAAPVKTKKGAAATDFAQILDSSVMTAAPSAESYAVKDAAEKFGKLFGKDLNRKDWLAYTNLDGKLDLSNIQASADEISELRILLYETDFDNDEKDMLSEKLKGFVSVEEYNKMKIQLFDHYLSPQERIKRGMNVNAGDVNKAVESK